MGGRGQKQPEAITNAQNANRIADIKQKNISLIKDMGARIPLSITENQDIEALKKYGYTEQNVSGLKIYREAVDGDSTSGKKTINPMSNLSRLSKEIRELNKDGYECIPVVLHKEYDKVKRWGTSISLEYLRVAIMIRKRDQ